MNASFSESLYFSKVRDELFGKETTSNSYPRFQSALMSNPRAGAVIQGTDGARKVRWADPLRGKGKRGGLRIIYYFYEEAARILLLTAYDQNIEDLTAEEKAEISRLIQEFRVEVTRSGSNKNGSGNKNT